MAEAHGALRGRKDVDKDGGGVRARPSETSLDFKVWKVIRVGRAITLLDTCLNNTLTIIYCTSEQAPKDHCGEVKHCSWLFAYLVLPNRMVGVLMRTCLAKSSVDHSPMISLTNSFLLTVQHRQYWFLL